MKKVFSVLVLVIMVAGYVTAQTGKPVKIDTETFKELVYDYEASPDKFVYKGDKPCIIDFYADWCGPCRAIAPTLEELAGDYKDDIIVYKVNTDQNRALARLFQVKSIPMVYFIPTEGDPTYTVGGMNKEGFEKVIKERLLN